MLRYRPCERSARPHSKATATITYHTSGKGCRIAPQCRQGSSSFGPSTSAPLMKLAASSSGARHRLQTLTGRKIVRPVRVPRSNVWTVRPALLVRLGLRYAHVRVQHGLCDREHARFDEVVAIERIECDFVDHGRVCWSDSIFAELVIRRVLRHN